MARLLSLLHKTLKSSRTGLVLIFLAGFAIAETDQWDISDADGALRIGPFHSMAEISLVSPELDRVELSYRIEDLSTRESLGFIVVSSRYADKASAAADLSRLLTLTPIIF